MLEDFQTESRLIDRLLLGGLPANPWRLNPKTDVSVTLERLFGSKFIGFVQAKTVDDAPFTFMEVAETFAGFAKGIDGQLR